MGKNEAGGQDEPSQLPRESDKREVGGDKASATVTRTSVKG